MQPFGTTNETEQEASESRTRSGKRTGGSERSLEWDDASGVRARPIYAALYACTKHSVHASVPWLVGGLCLNSKPFVCVAVDSFTWVCAKATLT